jgi:hypothetical protein
MSLLVPLQPASHALLGVESLLSYLRRLAAVYSLSLHQLLRFLNESREVSNLAGKDPSRMTADCPSTANSYVCSSADLANRVRAATGMSGPSAMTLRRIGPALTRKGGGALASTRRYCRLCIERMAEDAAHGIWEPLLWSMATISFCPIHKIPLDIATHGWKPLIAAPRKSRSTTGNRQYDDQSWSTHETLRILAFCADDPERLVPENSPSQFIAEYITAHGLDMSSFSKITGLSPTSVNRKVYDGQRTTLAGVFRIARALAICPLAILADPLDTAREASLFKVPGDSGRVRAPDYPSRFRGPSVHRQLLADIVSLLSSASQLPPFDSVCRARGVTPGFARHRMPIEVSQYVTRRDRELRLARERRRDLAYRVAHEALGGVTDLAEVRSFKAIERMLRARTSLPKHLLERSLQKARSDLELARDAIATTRGAI